MNKENVVIFLKKAGQVTLQILQFLYQVLVQMGGSIRVNFSALDRKNKNIVLGFSSVFFLCFCCSCNGFIQSWGNDNRIPAAVEPTEIQATQDTGEMEATKTTKEAELPSGEGLRGEVLEGTPRLTPSLEALVPTDEPTFTAVPTETDTPLPTDTNTPRPTNTSTSTPTLPPTNTATATSTNTPRPTNTATRRPTSVPTLPPAPTNPPAPPAAVCECGYNAYNCDDFSTKAAAQACFNYCKEQGRGDVHDLDRDNDNLVCESKSP